MFLNFDRYLSFMIIQNMEFVDLFDSPYFPKIHVIRIIFKWGILELQMRLLDHPNISTLTRRVHDGFWV